MHHPILIAFAILDILLLRVLVLALLFENKTPKEKYPNDTQAIYRAGNP